MLNYWAKFWFVKINSLHTQGRARQENDAIFECLLAFLIPGPIHIFLSRIRKQGIWVQSTKPTLNLGLWRRSRPVSHLRLQLWVVMRRSTNPVKTTAAQLVLTFYRKVRDVPYDWRQYKRTQKSLLPPTSLDLGYLQALVYRPPANAYSLFILRNKCRIYQAIKKASKKWIVTEILPVS